MIAAVRAESPVLRSKQVTAWHPVDDVQQTSLERFEFEILDQDAEISKMPTARPCRFKTRYSAIQRLERLRL